MTISMTPHTIFTRLRCYRQLYNHVDDITVQLCCCCIWSGLKYR